MITYDPYLVCPPNLPVAPALELAPQLVPLPVVLVLLTHTQTLFCTNKKKTARQAVCEGASQSS
jgi:hypothetical protein